MHINIYSNKTTEERFWTKVKKSKDGCWVWTGTISGGYGYISISGKMYLVHRFSYWLHNKKLPKGKGWHGVCVCHSCDNRKCVNPKHLWLGTHKQNVEDARKKGQFSREMNGRSKHDEKQVKLIRKLYATGKYSQRLLGDMFDVTHTNIYAIINHKLWK
jgi:HNH endonuclease